MTKIRSQSSTWTKRGLGTILWAIDENMGTNLQAFYKHCYTLVWKHKNSALINMLSWNTGWAKAVEQWNHNLSRFYLAIIVECIVCYRWRLISCQSVSYLAATYSTTPEHNNVDKSWTISPPILDNFIMNCALRYCTVRTSVIYFLRKLTQAKNPRIKHKSSNQVSLFRNLKFRYGNFRESGIPAYTSPNIIII